MIRLAAAGSDASTAKVSEWMTGDPDTIGPDIEARAAFTPLAEHGYRHIPVVEAPAPAETRRHRLDARPHARRDDPARRRPGARQCPKGLEGVVVADTTVGDVRGLEGFYHYRQYSAVDLAKTRPLEDVWYLLFKGRLPGDARRARRVRGRHPRPAARSPARSPTCCPRSRGPARRSCRSTRCAPRCRSTARRSGSARRTTSTTRRCATTRCRRARSCPR